MLTAIIIDDEPDALFSLNEDLKEYCPEVQVLEQCLKPSKALLAIKRLKPDIVFLDIHMPEMDGFQLLEVVGDINFDVIFVTADKEQAIRAFRLSAVHYLVKPIDPEDLLEAVSRIKEKSEHHLPPEQLRGLLDNLNSVNKRIAFQVGHDFELIALNNIIYLRADKDNTFVYVKEHTKKRIYTSKGIGTCEKALAHFNQFFRIHNSYIININNTKKLYVGEKYVEMITGDKLPVSNSKIELLKNQLRW